MITTEKTLSNNGYKPAAQTMQASLPLLPLIMNNIPQAIFWKDENLVYLGCNQAFAEDTGFASPADVIGKTDFDMPWKDQAELYRADDRLVMEQGEPKLNYEEPQTTPDGSIIWLRTSKIPVQEGGKTIAVLGMYEDITVHKQTEKAVSESEERFRRFTEATVEGLIFHERGIVIDVNPPAVRMIGASDPQEFIGKNLLEFIVPESRQLVLENMQSESVLPYEIQCIHKNGYTFPVETSTRAYKFGDREIRASSMRDITDRKHAEALLQQNEATLASALHIAQMGYWEFDLATGLFTLNDQYYSLHGRTAQEVGGYQIGIQRFSQEFVYPEDAAVVGAATQQAIETTDPNFQIRTEARIMHADGKPRWVTVWFRVEKDAQGRTIKLHGVNQDITERKQAEAELQQEKALSDAIINGLPGVFYLFNPDGNLIRWNKQYETVLGYTAEELATRNALDPIADEDKERTVAAIQQAFVEGQGSVEAGLITRDGRRFSYYFVGQRLQLGDQLYLAGTGIDITERKRLQAQVQEAFERRGLQVQLSTQVSQSIAAASSIEELYQRVVTQVKEQFGYYHTQLLRYDPAQEAVVLVTGYGEVGTQMLAARHHLPMGQGLIGTAAATGEAVLRPVLENDPDWHSHPLLPETKGEIAVPIKLGDTILGVLDVQSNLAGALGADDQLLLEGLCGQIATAIESTRLRQEMADRLEEINRLYRAMSHEGWQSYKATADIPSSFMFDQGLLKAAQDEELAQELFAKVPLTVPGGEKIGTLAIVDNPERPISPDDQTFVEQVAEQVALALENARLFEQTQSALASTQESESRLSEALNIARLANWEYDVEKDIFTFNDHFYSIFHTTAEKVGGYQLSSADYSRLFVHPDDMPIVGAEIGKALASTDRHYSVKLEHRILFADGGTGYISVDIHIDRDENGKILRYYGANQDITERKQAEIVIQESEAKLSEALNIAKLANWEYDFERDRFIFNDQFYSIFHITAEQVGGYELSAAQYAQFFVHPDDAALVGEEIGKAVASTDQHYSTKLEHRILFADGGVGYIAVDVHIDRDENGKITRWYGANQDITERKLAQEAITKRATELATVAQVGTTASTVLDPDKLLQSVVDLTKERFGLYHAHIYLVEESWKTLLLAAGAGEVGRQMVADGWNISLDHESSIVADAARNRASVIANDVYHDKESAFLSNRLLPDTRSEMAIPIIAGDRLLGVFDVQSDVTDAFTEADANIYITLASQVGVALQNARLYVEQAATLTQLRELDKLKSSFLANMSHELRTPLNSILGFTDVIMEGLDGPLTEHMDSDLRLIQKNGQHLLHLINDVLDMAKIEAGRMNLNPESFRAFEVLEEVASITSTLASEKNLSLFLDEESDRQVKIYADRTRLRQVMINLVNNSIKFTETGKISIKVTPMEGARILITVKDTGIGIDPNKLDAIFQEFTQVDSSTTRKAGGTGLGLPISRRLVEMHGGRLWADSNGIPGEGSTFFVEMPVEARITEVVEKQEK